MSLNDISTPVLLEAYEKAKELDLDEDFILILEKALNERIDKKVVNVN